MDSSEDELFTYLTDNHSKTKKEKKVKSKKKKKQKPVVQRSENDVKSPTECNKLDDEVNNESRQKSRYIMLTEDDFLKLCSIKSVKLPESMSGLKDLSKTLDHIKTKDIDDSVLEGGTLLASHLKDSEKTSDNTEQSDRSEDTSHPHHHYSGGHATDNQEQKEDSDSSKVEIVFVKLFDDKTEDETTDVLVDDPSKTDKELHTNFNCIATAVSPRKKAGWSVADEQQDHVKNIFPLDNKETIDSECVVPATEISEGKSDVRFSKTELNEKGIQNHCESNDCTDIKDNETQAPVSHSNTTQQKVQVRFERINNKLTRVVSVQEDSSAGYKSLCETDDDDSVASLVNNDNEINGEVETSAETSDTITVQQCNSCENLSAEDTPSLGESVTKATPSPGLQTDDRESVNDQGNQCNFDDDDESETEFNCENNFSDQESEGGGSDSVKTSEVNVIDVDLVSKSPCITKSDKSNVDIKPRRNEKHLAEDDKTDKKDDHNKENRSKPSVAENEIEEINLCTENKRLSTLATATVESKSNRKGATSTRKRKTAPYNDINDKNTVNAKKVRIGENDKQKLGRLRKNTANSSSSQTQNYVGEDVESASPEQDIEVTEKTSRTKCDEEDSSQMNIEKDKKYKSSKNKKDLNMEKKVVSSCSKKCKKIKTDKGKKQIEPTKCTAKTKVTGKLKKEQTKCTGTPKTKNSGKMKKEQTKHTPKAKVTGKVKKETKHTPKTNDSGKVKNKQTKINSKTKDSGKEIIEQNKSSTKSRKSKLNSVKSKTVKSQINSRRVQEKYRKRHLPYFSKFSDKAWKESLSDEAFEIDPKDRTEPVNVKKLIKSILFSPDEKRKYRRLQKTDKINRSSLKGESTNISDCEEAWLSNSSFPSAFPAFQFNGQIVTTSDNNTTINHSVTSNVKPDVIPNVQFTQLKPPH